MGISVTSSTGFSATQEQAQAYLQNHGNQATLDMARSKGYSNAQIASLLGVQTSEVDRFAASVSPAKVDHRIVTPLGHSVTHEEAVNYRALYGDKATYEKGKALGMRNSDMAWILGISTMEVDQFENTLRQSANQPSDMAVAPDLTRPSTQQQFLAQMLWLAPRNPNISNEEIANKTRDILAQLSARNFPPEGIGQTVVRELLENTVPIHQFVEAMQGEPGFSRENVEAFLLSQGLPPSPEGWRQAMDDSLIQNTRLMLDQKGLAGLDGSGVTVRVLEPADSIHGDVVSALINHHDFGLAPGADVEKRFEMDEAPESYEAIRNAFKVGLQQNFSYELQRLYVEAGSPPSGIDDPELVKTAFSRAVSNVAGQACFEGTTEQIRDFTQSNASVLNMSMGTTFSDLLIPALEVASEIVSAVPQLARALVPDPSKVNAVQYNQQITDFVAQAAFSGQASTAAHRDYVEATKEAAAAGKVIVVAAANEQLYVGKLKELGLKLPDLAALNALAMSEHVIAVGASKTNGTARNVADDTVTDFSSNGGTGFGVTTTTQGSNVAVPYTQYIELGGQVSGTSMAAPTVAATVALLKQYKPDVTFDEIKAWLIQNSVDTAATANAEGAGMLNLPGAAANA